MAEKQKNLTPKPNRRVKKFELRFQFDLKKILLWVLILFVGFSILGAFIEPPVVGEEISLSEALGKIKAGVVEEVVVEKNRLILKSEDKEDQFAFKEEEANVLEIFKEAGVETKGFKLTIKDYSGGRAIWNLLEIILPIGATFLIFYFIFRQARGSQDAIFSFGRSRAKLFSKGKQKVTFRDVGGIEEAKKELEEVVDFLKHPKKYQKLGARTPKGVFLVGPSGTGKTLLAKAVAGEANVPFFSMAGSEFMEMLVGVGPSRVRDLFSTAKRAAPSIIFIDELDAIGRMRGLGFAGGHGEQEQTLNQILVEMDGFTPNDNVIVMAATNRPDFLDPALIRPGRFDRRIVLDLPDIEERKKILLIHQKGKPFAKVVSWLKVARRTVGFSGADLENMLNEAAILAARGNKKVISVDDIEEAATKVKLGPEKKRLQSKQEKKMTAYHEAGHGVVAYLLPNMDPVHRISIVSRGLALGFTLIPPEKDKYTETKTELLEKITALLGGRAAEELVFNEFTGGAASDIDQATRIVRRMVIEYGMSDLGPIYLGPQVEKMEWGGSFSRRTELSEELQAKVDAEIKKIVDRCYQKAKEILGKQRKKLDLIAKKLIEQETIEGEEFAELMGKKKG